MPKFSIFYHFQWFSEMGEHFYLLKTELALLGKYWLRKVLTYSSKGDLVVLTLGPLFETVPYTTFSEFSREVIFNIISRAQIGPKLI